MYLQHMRLEEKSALLTGPWNMVRVERESEPTEAALRILSCHGNKIQAVTLCL